MKIWLTTDTHFGHDKLVEYAGRPEGFSVLIYKNLKAALHPSHMLIHLGDIGIGKDAEYHAAFIETLPSRKVLVRGNHDRKSNAWYLDHGWDFVCERFTDTYFGKRILFSHMPVKDDGFYDVNIHGHFHNSDFRVAQELAVKNDKQKLLALEYTDLKPVRLDDFLRDNSRSMQNAPGRLPCPLECVDIHTSFHSAACRIARCG